MSEERGGAPSRLRRQALRSRGVAPHSPELTSALVLTAGLFAIAAGGWRTAAALAEFVRTSIRWAGAPPGTESPLTSLAGSLLVPLGVIALAVLTVAVVAHQVQTGGLWAPGRLSPDFARLWGGGSRDSDEEPGARLGEMAARAGGGVLRVVVLALVSAGVLAVQMPAIAGLARLDMPQLIDEVARLLATSVACLSAAWVLLGLVQLVLRQRAFERMLGATVEEQREEQKAIEGDPATRSRRQRLSREWLRDPGEIVAGTSLTLVGEAGLTLLLAGGPPPRQVTVRTVARGVAASTLRHAAERAGVPVVRSPELARWLAGTTSRRSALPVDLASRLATIWPASHRRAAVMQRDTAHAPGGA